MRRDYLSDDFIPLSAPKIHGNLLRKGLKIQREGRGQPPLPLPKRSPRGCYTLGPPELLGCSQGGQSIRTPKSPRERRAALHGTAEQGCALWMLRDHHPRPTSTVPSRDTSRDMREGGGGSVTLSPALHPGQTPGNSSRRLKSALPRLGGLAQLPGRDAAAPPVPQLGDSCCQPGAVRMPEAEPGGNAAGNVRLEPSVRSRERGGVLAVMNPHGIMVLSSLG